MFPVIIEYVKCTSMNQTLISLVQIQRILYVAEQVTVGSCQIENANKLYGSEVPY